MYFGPRQQWLSIALGLRPACACCSEL